MAKYLYIFLDESGNFDFSSSGTRYFIFTSITKERPFEAYKELTELKYDLVEMGMDIEYFHSSEDSQDVRNQVFQIISDRLNGIRVDSLIVEKRKTGPAFRELEKFYPRMLGYLLRYIIERLQLAGVSEVIIFTDQIPISRKREAIEKAIKITLSQMLPKGIRYRVLHHDSKSNVDLQTADYCNWAIYRKWSRGDERSYNLIRTAIRSEFDIFRSGSTYYY